MRPLPASNTSAAEIWRRRRLPKGGALVAPFVQDCSNFLASVMNGRRYARRKHMRRDAMAGLVPAIHAVHIAKMPGGWLYFVTNRPSGTLYVGVTSKLSQRIRQHRTGEVEGFTKRPGSRDWSGMKPFRISAMRFSANAT